MPFDYLENVTTVITALKNYNTTTAAVDLSDGLNVRVNNDDIHNSEPEIEKSRADRLPAIYVYIAEKEEEGAALGPTGPSGTKKEAMLEYRIHGVFGKHGAHVAHSKVLEDVYKFAKNIEGVFQAEYQLSNTALWCNPSRTSFLPAGRIGESFAKEVVIRLDAKYLFR